MRSQLSPSHLLLLFRRVWVFMVTLGLFGGATSWSHNLDMQINYLIFDKETTALVQSRAAANQPLMQAGDTVGVILKATPNAGTKTGAGGYSTFFVPVGSQIVGAEYGVVQDNGTFQPLAMKGQSPLVHGQGPIDVQAPASLAGFTLGPNVLGVSSLSVDLKRIPWGTLAGLYGDTGIFYSTDPATAWQSWVNSGGIDKNPGTNDNAITNNKGDSIVPTTLWDAYQMFGFGIKSPSSPIIDPDGRGSTPWGTGTPVAGPESGYAWGFNKAYWDANPSNPNRMRNSLQVGPWKRIRYIGSEIAKDIPGRRSNSQLDVVGVNAEQYGVSVSPSTPLPPTTSWTDSTSPKALRLAWGGLELYRPEYCRIKVKILKNPGESGAPFDPNGYLQLFGETFGGDAGGEYGNKDHVWRYYKPSVIGLSASPMIEMVASKKIVIPNEVFWFDVRVTNLGNLAMTNAILENPLPGALTFVSATPAQNAGPSALRWNLGTLPPQSTRTFRINVRANATGLIINKATIRSNEFPTPKEAADTVTSDLIAIMYGDKTVTPATAAPGGKVVYKIVVRNDGPCPNRSPWKVREFLPEGFKYTRTVDQFINGARTSNTVVVPSASNINRPEFVINKALDAGKTLEIFFEAELSTTQAPGQYFNRYAVDYDDKVYATGLIAPVTVGGARVGDLVFQDWNGNGSRDGNEPGLAGVELQLWTDPNSDGNPADGVLVRTTSTNAQGEYNFGGTSTGNYVVKVNAGVPSGYQLTADPEGPLNGLAKLSLTNSTDRLDIDFGYRPLGTLTISGLVFSDFANDGIYQSASDTVINSIPLTLHFDANSNGTVDAPDIQIASTTTASGGAYTFSNIASGLSYIVSVSTTAPALTTFFDPFTFKPSSPARIALGSLSANTSGRNFGFFADRPASIGDQVFQDLNRNGVYDSGDLPIPRVTVKLYRDLNNNKAPNAGEYLREVVTDNRGQYLFTDLSGDNYISEVDLTDPDLPGGLALAPPHIAVTILPSEQNLNIDFALKRVLSLTVSPTGTVAPGSRLTYSLQANYPQVGQFNNVTVTDTIPTGTTYTASSASTGGTFASNTVSWNLGSTSSSVANTHIPVITCVRNVRIEVDASIDDTYIRADSASTVYSEGNMILRPSSAATQRQALIRFLTTEIPAGATVLSATVGLRVATTRTNQTVNLYPMNTNWDVAVATWNDPNGTASGRWASGTTFSSLDYNSSLSLGSMSVSSVGYKLVTSTNLRNLVQGWVNDPSTNRGIGIITMGTDTGDAQLFSVSSTINNVPYLDVQYSYVAADACGVDSRGAAYWARNGLLNGRTAAWNGGSFDATQTTPALAADLEFIVGASCSKRDEKITAGILEQAENNIVGQMWNGSAWTNLPLNPLGKAATTGEVGVAVAYEQLSGDAVLVWTDRYQANGQRLRFSVWNGTSWTSPVSITSYTGAEPSGMKMVAKPDSDEMALVIEDWNYAKHALIWNGSSWNSSTQLTPGTSDNNNIFDFAVAYENLTGRAMALYGKNGQNHVYYRIWNGSSWTAEASRTAPTGMGRKRHFTAASDPGGNNIAVGVITEGSDAWCSIWNGTSWSAGNVVETDLSTREAPTLAIAFESQSGDLVAAYSQNNFKGVKYVTWSPTTSTWSAEADAIPLGGDANSLILQSDLNTNEIMLVAQDDNLDLVVTRWSENIWKGYRELEDNTGENTKQPFIYLWDAHDRNPNPPLTTAEGLFGPASVINNAQIVNVSTTLTSSRNIDSIVAPDPSFVTLSGTGLTATKLTGPTPGPSTIGNRGTTFTWTYRINGGTSPARGLFRWAQFTSGVATFPTTDSNSFIYVPTLTYQVDVTAPPPNPVITNQASINLGFGAILSNTVSTSLSESIGDYVWADYNMDGNQDPDEPGLPGVRIFIDANNNGLFDPTERNATSNSQGLYTITGVGVGTHQVTLDVVTLPADFVATTATRLTRTLAASQSSFTCDFGVAPRPPEVAAGFIGGLVWIDSNADGLVDVLETGFTGVITKLWADANANGTLESTDYLVASTTSDADGRYLFSKLFSGRYLVTTEPLASTGVALVSGHTPLTGVIGINLAAAQSYLSADFGYRHTASIGDFVYYDFNGNGIRNPNGIDGIAGNADDEVGIFDATVQLIVDSNADGVAGPFEPVYGITSTNASGFYLFPNLPPGRYVAKAEEQSVIAPPSSENAGLVGFMLPTSPEGVAVNLAPAQAFLNADYGFIEKSIIEGYVYHDVDSSTLKDPAEPGLANVDVRIIGTDSRGNPVDLTVTTNGGGEYTHFVAPGSYTLTYNTADPDIPVGLTRATTPLAYTLDVLPGKELEGFDFGRDHNGTLGGRVFNDDNSNGTQNRGEDGIPDITIQLFDSAGTTLLTTTTTSHLGDYRFTGLQDGTFTIVVLHSSLPLGYNTTPTADPDSVKDGRSRPVVTSTTPNLTQIFGYRHASATHTLSGLIFDDNGAGGGVFSNGVRDGTEPGLAGASIRIEIDLDKDGTTDEYRVATSEANGDFISNGVPTAANIVLYVLDRSLPRRAYTPTRDPNGPTDGRATLSAITGNVPNLVFGFALKPSTISGSVVLGDGNGIADPGEAPLANVIVGLTYGGNDDVIGTPDDIVTTRTTDATGLYSADNLDPGVFQIVQSVPFGYKPRADADGGVPTNISLSVAPGALPTKQDFENYQLPQIRGRVLVDADRSGDISIDDTPVQGVTVRLFTDVNGNGLKDAEDTQVNTFVTDALGVYRFGPISDPAKFLVQHDLPNTMISITDADGNANGSNHMAVAVEELDINNRDFLNRPIPMTLGGRVFNDINSNALLDGTETGISALQVRLFDSATSQQIGTVNTLADGSYSFNGLWPGNYFVQITPPSNLPSTGGTPVALDNDIDNDSNALQPGGPGTTVSSPVINMAVNTESITDGDTNPNTNLTVDLGLWSGLDLGNLVWNDSNNNGIKGTTESGVSGISVRLFTPGSDNAFGGTGSAADTLVTTVTTNSSGNYNFRIYTPGRYYVRITPPSTHALASTTSVNLDNGVNDDSNGIQLGSSGNDIISPVILLTAGGEPGSAGTTNTEDTIDIGLRACPAVSISPTTVLPGAVYGSYTQAFVATGGVAPRTFRISSGALPNGLTLSSGGVINGTINANPGNYWFRLEARDNQGCIGTRDYTLNVTCPNPVVTPAGPALPEAWHWENYSQTFTATGVAAAYTWSISSGSLPSGLTLNATSGVLSGTVTGAPATYSFTVRATDPLGFCVTDRAMTLLVRGRWDYGDLADSITGTSANASAATADHSTRFSDNGPRHSIRPGFRLGATVDEETDGQPGFLADGDGTDEDGLTLPATIVAGSSVNATISVTNTIGVTARGNLWIDWNSNGSFEDAGERLVNNSTITGSRSYTITVPIGAVLNRPLGVRVRLTSFSLINSLGVATDGEVEDYLITAVCPTISISTPALPTWYLGAPMTQTFSASGGTAPYNWTLSSGSLPPGLTLTNAGTLSGTPSATGSYPITLRATDAYGCSVTRSYTAVVKGITVGNLVFNDTDDNGIRSAWELGVSGVTLQAFNPGADLAIGGTGANADTLIATVISDSMGAYGFDNLPVGPVYIRLTPPSTLRVTSGRPVTIDNGVNNDNNGAQPGGPGTTLFSPIITLAAGLESIADGDNDPDTELSIDFGIWSGVGIGSTLWGDANSNGRIDASENGFGSVTVQLWRDVDGDVGNGAEVYVAETTSNVAGNYTFLGYPSGRYQIVIPNSNFVPGGPLNPAPFASPVRAYSDDQIDDDSNAIQFLGGGTEARSPIVTLAAGDEPIGSGLGGVSGEFGRGGNLDDSFPDENADMTLDMGFVAAGSIGVGNLVFVDNNDNGRADSGEGVNGITVQLFYAGDNPLTDPPLLTTTTANGGRYLFSIVWQGNFFVYLPKDQFTTSGLLSSTFPIPGTVPGDDDVGEDSITTSEPWITGVRSQDFVIANGSAPTTATGETGTDASSDDAFDSSSDLTIDIGLFRPVGIGNLVFFDANENGRADAGEGVSGVLVELYRENQTPGFNAPVKSTTTQADGTYLFDLITAGNYRVHIPASQFGSGMPLFRAVSIAEGLAGDDDVGEDGINATNPALTGITSRLVTLIPGNTPTLSDGETGVNASSDDDFDSAVDLTIDFGFQDPVGLGNLVFVDFNNDGTYTSGEGIAGVRVELYLASQTPGADVPIFTQTTAADGHYFFGSLFAGDYRVHIPASQFRNGAALANLTPLALNAAGDDDSGQDGITAGIPAVNGVSTAIISLTTGSSPMNFTSESGYRNTDDDLYDNNFDLTIDIGFGPPNNTTVGVGSLVYHDLNGNSRFDSGEGAANVAIQLFLAGQDPQVAAPLATTTSDLNGLYIFTSLTPGDYFLHIPASQFITGGALANLFSLPGNGTDNGIDDDIDENGIDSTTPATTGISSSPFNLALGAEPTNDSSEFGEGTYLDALADNNHDLTIDFGFYESVGLGNLVFIDANGNNRADAGEGVPSVQIELYPNGSLPGWNVPFATTTTDSMGRYAFNDLRPGSYYVHIPYTQFVAPAPLAGLLSLTGTTAGDDDLGENGSDEAQPESYGITSTLVSLTPAEAPVGTAESGLFGSDDDAKDHLFDATVDFGFASRMSVGNLVFSDTNGDGIFNPVTESGVEGVDIELWHNANTTSPAATTQTQADGTYSFSVAPGTYSVRIPISEFQPGAPLAYTESSKNLTTTVPTTAGDDNVGEDGLDLGDPAVNGVATPWFTLTPGSAPTDATTETGYFAADDNAQDNMSDLTVDLGFTPKPLAVGNLVFNDVNLDGRYTAGTDQPVSGVPIRLFRVGDNPLSATPVAMTVSALDGSYLLKTATPGFYFVHIPPSAFASTGVLFGASSIPGFGDDDGIDDDADENGIDSANPATTGTNSIAFELAFGSEPVTAANAPGIETGAFANSDATNEAITDLTIDFGFVGASNINRVALGNIVYRDLNTNGRFDEGEGVDGVWMLLYDANNPAGPAAQLASTFTSGGGRYLFSNLPAGQYVVHVAADNFKPLISLNGGTPAPGPLFGQISRTGVGTGDDNLTEDGIDNANPAQSGINSATVTLTPGSAPLQTGTETGASLAMNATLGDSNTDLTIDFSFVAAPPPPNSLRESNTITLAGTSDNDDNTDDTSLAAAPETYLEWQTRHNLGSLSAPAQDADNDGLTNLLEYALDLDPLSGFEQRPAIGFDTPSGLAITYTRPANGHQDARYQLQVLADLGANPTTWTALDASSATTIQNPDGSETLTFAAPVGWTQGFVRLSVALDTDGNGSPEGQSITPIHAWLTPMLATGQQSLSQPLLQHALFCGSVQRTGNGSLSLPITSNIASSFVAGRQYYLELSSGHRFEIDELTSQDSTLVLDLGAASNTASSLPTDLSTTRAAIREHWSLDALLPSTHLTAAAYADLADRALFFNSASNQFEACWLQSGTTATWTTDTTAPGFLAPGSALLVHRRGNPTTLLWTGLVRDHAFRLTLRPGTQFIASGSPITHSPASLNFTTAAGLLSGTAATSSDRLRLWIGDTQPGSTGYHSFYFMKTAQGSRWVNQSDATFQDVSSTPLFAPARGLFLQRLPNTAPLVLTFPAE